VAIKFNRPVRSTVRAWSGQADMGAMERYKRVQEEFCNERGKGDY